MVDIIGLIGLVCIVASFIPETIQTIKDGKVKIPYPFLVLYLVGSVFLMIHALSLNDVTFVSLNGILAIESVINLYYKAFPRK